MNKLEQYYRINQVAGVHIHIHPDSRTTLQICTIIANGNQLQIDKKITDLASPGQLKEHLPAKSIIALNLSGKGILQKRIERTEVIDQNTFSKILPNAKSEDFYIQNFVSGESSFVSLIRRTEADKWISQLQELQFIPLMLSLGPFPIDGIVPQLNIYESELLFNGYLIRRNEKAEWIECLYDETVHSAFPIKLASEKIDEKLIIPYAAAFQLVLKNNLEPVKANVDHLETGFQKKLSDQKIRVQSVVVLIVLFALLLINFILFSWLNSSNNALTERVSRYAQNSSNQQEINERVKIKEARLRSLGWDGGIDKSHLLDQIASLLPPEISMKEIAVNPIDQAQSRTQKTLSFYERKIQVTGNSERIIPVNEWIARIKTKTWVKNIQLENFAYNNELNTGQFTVIINY
jgi:Tfp pilus assembly protein PilN